MATRNRTLLFRKYMNSLRSVQAPLSVIFIVPMLLLVPTIVGIRDHSSKGALTVGLPPAWVEVSEEISVNIQRARTKMAELGKAHGKALMPSFGDGKEDQQIIEYLTQETTFLLKKSEKQLKIQV